MDRTRFYPTERNHLALVTMIIPEAHERLVHTMRSTRECKACITTRTRGAPAANAGLLLHLLARRARVLYLPLVTSPLLLVKRTASSSSHVVLSSAGSPGAPSTARWGDGWPRAGSASCSAPGSHRRSARRAPALQGSPSRTPSGRRR